MQSALGTSLNRLEELLEAPELSLDALGRLAEPSRLGHLLLLQMVTLVRCGPQGSAVLTPARLMERAQAVAGAGGIPLLTLARLRKLLARLEGEIKAAGAWDTGAPMWWHVLPELTPLESFWRSLDETVSSSLAKDVSHAFAAGGAHWWFAPKVFDQASVEQVHRELESAWGRGSLRLEQGGVGSAGELSDRRSDFVAYMSGMEPELLEIVPSLAALVQWGLARWVDLLGSGLCAEGELVAPEYAMLARYPGPSGGYARHLDNPGGSEDNGRARSLVLYLNPQAAPCVGGDLAVWRPGARADAPPDKLIPPTGGSAAIFDSRRAPHQVLPLSPGPARWALTFWLNSRAAPRPESPVPELSISDILRPLISPTSAVSAPVPPRTVLCHELGGADGGRVTIRKVPKDRPRAALVSTVYRAPDLGAWCRFHLDQGFERLILIFDRGHEPAEQAAAERLRSTIPADRLDLWIGDEVIEKRWPTLFEEPRLQALLPHALEGGSSHAVACRQTLHASAALVAARSGELGEIDWLLHLDADELFHLQGAAQGGGSLVEHFAVVESAGFERVRYVNHELLPVSSSGELPCFKLNPDLAGIRLGAHGWRAMVDHLDLGQLSQRPYFQGYTNGKSAVSVRSGVAAAGVHGWYTENPQPKSELYISGPSILHVHRPSRESFRRKYLTIAEAPRPLGPRLFPPSPVEERAMALIGSVSQLAGDNRAALEEGLDALFQRLNAFSERDLAWLEEAGLLYRPKLSQPWPGGRAWWG